MLALVTCLSLVGCSAKEETTTAATTAATTAVTEATTAATEAANPYADLVAKLGDDTTIRLATPGNYAPFTIYNEAEKTWDGFEINLWNIMAEKTGLELELVQIDNPATFAELDLGRVDTVAKQISITPARQEKYDFTQPFFFSPYCLTVPEDNDDIKTWADMEGKAIALAEGSAMNEFVAQRDPDNKVQKNVYESSGVILQQVMLGRADAAPWAYLVLPYTMQQKPDLKLKSVDIDNPIYTEVNAYPFARTERGAAMLELIDTVLGDMIEDGSYGELCTEWFGMDVMESQPAKDYFAANPKN
ncbi:MAG: transporter substrate-binding domain-containing protein [Clostridia bacterium]|nr:transporter substrate-binding domain-containing protein [Clostridia bacterium]